jgi:hypothetical protein
MTQADSVHRPMGKAKMDAGRTLTSAEVDARRSEAFFQMEAPLRECFERAEIAAILFDQDRQDLCSDICA